MYEIHTDVYCPSSNKVPKPLRTVISHNCSTEQRTTLQNLTGSNIAAWKSVCNLKLTNRLVLRVSGKRLFIDARERRGRYLRPMVFCTVPNVQSSVGKKRPFKFVSVNVAHSCRSQKKITLTSDDVDSACHRITTPTGRGDGTGLVANLTPPVTSRIMTRIVC